jgi:hypothetical protein
VPSWRYRSIPYAESSSFFAVHTHAEEGVMVIVRFNQWEEFLAEMQESPPEDRTVRVTFSLRYDGQGAAHLSMVAGYCGPNTIVEFLHYLGLEPRDRESSRSKEIKALFEERRNHLKSLGYLVRSGRYHVAPNLNR